MITEHQPANVPALTDQHREGKPRPPRIAVRRTAGSAVGPRWLQGLILLILLVTFGIAGCSRSGPTAAPATPKAAATPTAPAATPTAPAAPAATPTAPAATPTAPGGNALPEYKPSTVISNGHGTTVLKSASSVGKVAAFYENALKSGGWHWHSTARSQYSAHFEATKGSARAVVQISSAGRGVSISVTVTG